MIVQGMMVWYLVSALFLRHAEKLYKIVVNGSISTWYFDEIDILIEIPSGNVSIS